MTPSDDVHLREDLLERRPAFEGRLLKAYVDTVRLPSGGTGTREVVEHPGAVAIVALSDDGQVALVRQWRHAVGRAQWEIPAGTLEPGEAPEACAVRELEEETGYSAARWRHLGSGACSPGYSSEMLHLFLAEGLTAGTAHTDVDETVDLQLFDRAGVERLLEEGGTDLKTVAGLAAAGWLGAPVQR